MSGKSSVPHSCLSRGRTLSVPDIEFKAQTSERRCRFSHCPVLYFPESTQVSLP
jgi:hypothetical protein